MIVVAGLQIKKNWYKGPNVLYSDMLGVVAEESSSFMEKHGILDSARQI